MSPELLGWHERQGLDSSQTSPASPKSVARRLELQQQLANFQFLRAPASALKSKKAAELSTLGKAVRVKTPAKYGS